MSVPELARAASLDRRTVANLEAGRSTPTFATLRQIAEALGVPVKALVGG
jgi:transcriptional regulator with XRE-family HTH domain